MAVTPGIEHVRHQHRVVVGHDVDAAPHEYLPDEFQVMSDLDHAGSAKSGLMRVECGAFGDLVRRHFAAEQSAGAVAALAVRRAAHSRLRSARAQAKSRRALPASDRGSSLGISRATKPRSRARSIQALSRFERADRFVFRRGRISGARGFEPRRGELLRRERAMGAVILGGRRLRLLARRQVIACCAARPIEAAGVAAFPAFAVAAGVRRTDSLRVRARSRWYRYRQIRRRGASASENSIAFKNAISRL